MHFTLEGLIELVAQEWYVLCAYFAIFVLLEVRKNGEQIANASRGSSCALGRVLRDSPARRDGVGGLDTPDRL